MEIDKSTLVPISSLPTNADCAEKAKVKKVLEEIRSNLILIQPFIALMAMKLDLVPVVDYRLPTACVDGESIFINPYFLAKLDQDEQIFLIAHEVWHCALLHSLRCQSRMERVWDLSTDHEVNCLLKAQDFKVPHESVIFQKKEDMNAEEIYEWITKLMKSSNAQNMINALVRPQKSDIHINSANRFNNIKVNVNGKIDPDFSPHWNEAVMKRWQGNIVAAAQQTTRTWGALPGNVQAIVNSYSKPKISWKEKIRQYLTCHIGGSRIWLPPNRRYISQGLYLPSHKGSVLRVTIAIDTSGSTKDILSQFLCEVNCLLTSFSNYETTIIQCDAEIQKVETFTFDNQFNPNKYEVQGLGGTSFFPVFRLIEKTHEQPKILLYFTDGFGDVPSQAPQYPVIWCMPSLNGHPPTEWGEVIYIE